MSNELVLMDGWMDGYIVHTSSKLGGMLVVWTFFVIVLKFTQMLGYLSLKGHAFIQ
jgi:hypothetical protein